MSFSTIVRRREIAATPTGGPPCDRWGRSIFPALTNAAVFVGHRGCVNTTQWSDDARHVISGSDDTVVCVFPASAPKAQPNASLRAARVAALIRFESGHRGNIFGARLLAPSLGRECATFVTCARDGHVRLHQIRASGTKIQKSLSRHSGSSQRLALEPDCGHERFSSVGEDGCLKFYDLRGGGGAGEDTVVSTYKLVKSGDEPLGLNAVAYRPHVPHEVLVAGEESVSTGARVRIFDVRRMSRPACVIEMTTDTVGTSVTGAAWSLDGNRIVATVNDEHTHVLTVGVAGRCGPDACQDVRLFSAGPMPGAPFVLTAINADDEQQPPEPISAGAYHHHSRMSVINAAPLGPRPLSSCPLRQRASDLPVGTKHPQAGVTCIGHRNFLTVKGVAFFGPRSEFVLQPCDTGRIVVYDSTSGVPLAAFLADAEGPPNNLAAHPHGLPQLLSSGIEHTSRLWTPSLETKRPFDEAARLNFERMAARFSLMRRFPFSADDDDDEEDDEHDEDENEDDDGDIEDVDDADGGSNEEDGADGGTTTSSSSTIDSSDSADTDETDRHSPDGHSLPDNMSALGAMADEALNYI